MKINSINQKYKNSILIRLLETCPPVTGFSTLYYFKGRKYRNNVEYNKIDE